MGFFNQRCPNCGKSVSKDAPHCSACGCPTATKWASCHRCGTSVGAESKFCWKCGEEQKPEGRERFFGDRWRRSAGDFAARVELRVPGEVLHAGLLIDEGTLAVVFQDGVRKGEFGPGYHTMDSFFSKLMGFNKNASAHAILLDTEAAEVDFMLEDVRLKGLVPVDLRLRLLFKISDPATFVSTMIGNAETFDVFELAQRFQADVKGAVEHALQDQELDKIVFAVSEREILETGVVEKLAPILGASGLAIGGVRLAQFGGPAYAQLKEKFGELERLSREAEAARELRDAVRKDKVAAYHDEEELDAAFARVKQEYALQEIDRTQELERFRQAAESQTQVESLRLDYEARRTEILNRLDEQKLRHQSELADTQADLERQRVVFEEDMRQQRERFKAGQEQQVEQSKTDLEVAKQGVEALKAVRSAKNELRREEEKLNTEIEAERLKLRGEASLQGLLSTLSGEQADRVLKLAELEMRKGLSAEQALALIAEKSPEIAPSVAEAIKAREKQAQPPSESSAAD